MSKHRGHKIPWCPGRDSNPHGLPRRILSPLRLPFRHLGWGIIIPAMSLEDVRAMVLDSPIAPYAEQIERLLRPTVYLRTAPEQKAAPLGASKLGGAPDMPPEFEWPHYNETPLSFLAQINLSEVKPYDLENLLPEAGMLYFFCTTDEIPWGDAEEWGRWRVYYYDGDLKRIISTAPPPALPKEGQFPEIPLYPELIYTLPDWTEELEFVAPEFYRQLNESESDAYHNLRWDLIPDPRHWMLGYHAAIQSAANIEAAQEMYGLSYEMAQIRAQELTLLLQIDSDEDADMMWGDVGTLYFWIHKDDLAERRFDKVWLIMQCY